MSYFPKPIIFLALLSAAAIAACVPEESAENVRVVEEPMRNTIPARDNRFAVDADVTLLAGTDADVLFAEYVMYDELVLRDYFYNGNHPPREESPVFNSVVYQDEDSYFVVSDRYILYQAKEFMQVQSSIEGLVAVNDVLPDGPAKGFGDVYRQENLDFMTRTEAEAAVRGFLDQFSVNLDGQAEIYAIDAATMQQQQDEKRPESTGGYQTRGKFTADDEYYIMFFTVKENRVPVTHQSYDIMAGERRIWGSVVRVCFSRKGVIELYLSGIYETQGIAQSPADFVTAEEALEKARAVSRTVISSEKITVTDIDFVYVPVPYNDDYNAVMLTPAWELTLTGEYAVPSADGALANKMPEAVTASGSRTMFIDAVTGAEIK